MVPLPVSLALVESGSGLWLFTFKPRRIVSTVAAVVCRNEKAVVFMLLLMSTMLGCLSKWFAHIEAKSTFVSGFLGHVYVFSNR